DVVYALESPFRELPVCRSRTPKTRIYSEALCNSSARPGIAAVERSPTGHEHVAWHRVCANAGCRRRWPGATVPGAMRRRRADEAANDDLVELVALADGSVAPERRAALEASVASSSDIADRLAEQERALALVRSAAAEVDAPPALRARIDAQ